MSKTKHPLLTHPFRLVVHSPNALRFALLADWDLGKANILHHCPDNGEARSLRREGVDRVSTLSHIAKEAFNGIGCANVAMHDWWKDVEGQKMFLVFHQTAHRFRIALLIFGFESLQIEQCFLLCRLLPDTCQLGGDLLLLSFGDGIHHIPHFVDHTTLA